MDKKQKKRQEKVRDKTEKTRARILRSEVLSRLPGHTVKQHDKIDERFLELLEEAWRNIAFAKELNGNMARDLELARDHGFAQTKLGEMRWSLLLGELLYRELAAIVEPVTLRRHDFNVVTSEWRSHVNIAVRALESVKPFVACSPMRPKIMIGDKDYLVAYNLRDDDHFIRRLEERTVVESSNYFCKGQVFACLYRWQYFDLIELPNGQPAVKLWNWCDPRTTLASIWRELLPNVEVTADFGLIPYFDGEEGRAYYLVGYCPIDERGPEEGIAILKTLLLPGMENTPEESVLTRRMSTIERAKFSKQVGAQTMRLLSIERDFSLIRKFHEHVPQVRLIKDEVFRY